MSMADKMKALLMAECSPNAVEVENVSHLHQGHAGSPNTGESHFNLKIVGGPLADLSRVAAHRKVMTLFKPLFSEGLHAVSLKVTKAE